jgi:multiple sugar transport system substrate-binding protein
MKTMISFVVLVVVATSVFAGGNRSESPAKNRRREQIRWTNWEGGAALEIEQKVAQSFNASQDKYEAVIMNVPSDYDTKLMAMIAAGDTPEIATMESGTLLYPLAEEGYVLNLKEFIDSDPAFDGKTLIDSLMYWLNSDYLAGYSIGAEMMGLFYNPEIFRKYGVREPPARYADAWDWDTFVNTAQRLTIDNKGNNALSPNFDANNIVTYGFTFGKWFAVYYAFYYTTGAPIITDGGKTLGLLSPDGVDTMQKLADLIVKYHVSPTPTASASLPGGTEAYLTGKVAMSIDGHWSNDPFMADDVTYNVAALPKIKVPASIAVAGALSVLNTPKKEGAWEFFKYISRTGTMREMETSGAWLPVTKEGLTETYLKTIITPKHPSNYYGAFCAPMLDGTAKRTISGWLVDFNRIDTEFSGMLDPLWTGEKTFQQLVNEHGSRINSLLRGERSAGSF